MTSACSLIIDTTLYSGNFERPLCAWVTGQVGECGVGEDVAAKALATLRNKQWWEEHVVQTYDEDGCQRPVASAPTPGFANDGLGGHYPDTPEGRAEALPRYRASVQANFERESSMYDRVTVGKNGWTQEGLDKELARVAERRDKEMASTEVKSYPAYQSVEIFLDEEPTDEVLNEVRERLRQVVQDPYGTGVFVSYGDTHKPAEGFEVTGLRISVTPKPEQAKVRKLAL